MSAEKTPQHEQPTSNDGADSTDIKDQQNVKKDEHADSAQSATKAEKDAAKVKQEEHAKAKQKQTESDDALFEAKKEVKEALMKDLEAAQQQVAAFKDEYLRARAEVENIRRRADEEVAKVRKFAVEGFAESLLPVRDSLEAALSQTEQTVEDLQQGVETTLRQLDRVFERHQLKEVSPQVGDAFDPHLHQAISTIPSKQKKGTVAQVLQKGYVLADRVLRPAMVMVSDGT